MMIDSGDELKNTIHIAKFKCSDTSYLNRIEFLGLCFKNFDVNNFFLLCIRFVKRDIKKYINLQIFN